MKIPLIPVFFLLSFVFYILIATLVNADFFHSADISSMHAIQRILPTGVDLPFSILSYLGSTEIVILTILIITFFWYKLRLKLSLGLFLIVCIYVFELFGKLTVYHPKPPSTLYRGVLDIRLPSRQLIQTAYSFPSGHMARTTFTFTMLGFILYRQSTNPRSKVISILIPFVVFILMGVSRVYLGEHWISDVLGGFILGIMMSFLAVKMVDF